MRIAAAAEADTLENSLRAVAKLMPLGKFDVTEQFLPSGIYHQWRRSFNWPDYIFKGLCRVWREGPLTRWKAYEAAVRGFLHRDEHPPEPSHRKLGPSYLMAISSALTMPPASLWSSRKAGCFG